MDVDKWTAPEPREFAWGVITTAENCPNREGDICKPVLSSEPVKKCTYENCTLTIKRAICESCSVNKKEKEGREDCKCNADRSTFFDHTSCNKCGLIQVDSGWGIASRKYFTSLQEAEFYKANGRYPD